MSNPLNITTAAFGGLREVTTSPLWQWDYGQILKIKGLDLPQAFEVHFSNSRKSGETITQIGTDSQVTIPDMYLTSGADIYAFIFLHDGLTDGETEYVIKIPVRERPEPSDIEPTPEQQDAITEAIAALNVAVTQTGEDKAATAALAEAAAASSLIATEAAQSAQGSATSASGSATTASTAAATATQKASEAATSAANAASAKTAAETAETNAQAAQTASESANASAESAAQTATAKASEASTSATSASSSASAASASASAASESATQAANSATAASGSATSAATSASTASTKASEASASATAANTAKTAAEAAQTAAETAASTFETDTTLTVSGKAADAKASGDVINNAEDLITPRYAVEQGGFTTKGRNTDSSDSNFYKRVRTVGFIPVTEGETYKILADYAEGMQYGVSFYTSNSYSIDRISNIGMQDFDLTFTVPATAKYCRFIFSKGTTVIAPSAVSNVRALLAAQNPALTDNAIQNKNIEEINALVLDGISENFMLAQGGFNDYGIESTSNYRLRTLHFRVQELTTISASYVSENSFEISFSFYVDDDPATQRLGYAAFAAPNTKRVIPKGTRYARALVKRSSGSAISPSALSEIKITTSSLSDNVNDLEEKSALVKFITDEPNVFSDKLTLSQGTLNSSGQAANNTARVRINEYLPFLEYRGITVNANNNTGYDFIAYYYTTDADNPTAISGSGWIPCGSFAFAAEGTKYLRFAIRKHDDTTLAPSDITSVSVDIYTINDNVKDLTDKVLITSDDYSVDCRLKKSPVIMTLVGQLTYAQSFCVYDGKFYSTDGSNIGVQSADLTAESSTAISVGHGNAMHTGILHPEYAYISGWDDQKIYIVDLTTITLVDTITLPTTGYTTGVVDDLNGIVYILQRNTSPSTEEHYNFIAYDYVNDTELYRRKTFLSFGALQAMDYVDGKIYVNNGKGTASLPNHHIVYNTSGDVIAEFVLQTISDKEPEGICVDGNDLYVSTYQNKNLYKITTP